MHFLSSRGLKIWVGIALLKKKEMYFLEKAAVGKKAVEKAGKGLRCRILRLHRGCGRIRGFFHLDFFERPFSTGKFFFSTEDVEKSGHRLELIFCLDLIHHFGNAASFFIFFSICWME